MTTEADASYAVGWLENHFEKIERTECREEGLKHVGAIEKFLKGQSTENSNLAIELAQLKLEISQSQNAKQKTKESEDWKRLVYLDTDGEGRTFVYVKVDFSGDEFAAGEAFLNSAMQVEFEPQPNTALTITYLDAISKLLKNRSHELRIKNV